jgi:hypothetical protein
MSLRLVPLRGKVNGSAEPAVVMWVNPDHIVSVRPKISGTVPAIDVHVELKLEGLPLFDSWLGQFKTADAADSAWTALLAELTGVTSTA